MKEKLDFVVIGAHKSGTSTLFELLKQHEQIYLPWGKEVPFFGSAQEKLGWEAYLNEHFLSDPSSGNKLWGTVTPQYMTSTCFAEKIYALNPETKIIAILREPISRAFSHYQMSKRRLLEKLTFEERIKELLTPNNLDLARNHPNSTNAYIAWGEYGRVLKSYLNFKREQILICFTNELEENPQKVIDEICDFLNINRFSPKNLGKKFHQGGEVRVKAVNDFFRRKMYFKEVVEKIIGKKLYVNLRFKLHQANNKQKKEKPNLNKKQLNSLITVYKEDLDLLETNFQIKAPWRELYDKEAHVKKHHNHK